MNMDGKPFKLRKPCACGEQTNGVIRVVGVQNTVRCATCGAWGGFNAPKHETGEAVQPVNKREPMSASQRARILIRDGSMCLVCGRSPAMHGVNLHVSHILSVENARSALEDGLITEDLLADDENFITLCDACNLGQRKYSFRLRHILALLLRQYAASTRK